MIQEEYLLSRTIMQELCTEAAKLKILGAMEMIPTEKLVRLLNMLELNIRGGDRVSPISDVIIPIYIGFPRNLYILMALFKRLSFQ